MQRAKSGKTWKEHSWVKRPQTEKEQKAKWAEHSWEKRTESSEKPGWREHSWVKRSTSEEKPSWKEHSWEKRPTTVNLEKPTWKEHSWVKRQVRGAEDNPTWTARQNSCNNELSSKFSAMDSKMEYMAKIIQNSLSLLDKKVEGLLDQINTNSGALTKPVDHDRIEKRKGKKSLRGIF